MTFEIEKDIGIPNRPGPSPKYPLHLMEIGDSFFISENNFSQKRHPYAHMAERVRKLGIKITTRKVEGGWRVWRIE